MPTGQPNDWRKIETDAAALVAAGSVAPNFSALARALSVNRKSFYEHMLARGIDAQLLKSPASWPAPEGGNGGGGGEEFDGISVDAVMRALKEGPLALSELADKLDRGASSVQSAIGGMIARGYSITREDGKVKRAKYAQPERARVLSDEQATALRFAVASDLHIGSKAAQVSALRAFLDLAVKKYECQHILVPGDLTAGYRVYRGQENEVYAHGSSEQLDALVNTLPQYAGVKYYMLGGNHDYSFVKTSGYDLVSAACMLRSDWTFLGYDEAAIPLTHALDVVLWHPSGGVPYALTYRGQKYAAELAQRELVEVIVGKKERPRTRFIFWGHLHVAASFPHGPIRVIGPGCFEGRNSYLKQKGLTPKIQGVIVDVALTPDGLIQRYTPHEIEFVEEDDDWRNAFNPSVARRARETVEPLFSLR